MSDIIFSGLENLGFKDLKDLELYKTKEEKPSEKDIKQKQKEAIEIHIYDKEVTCPVCDTSFKVKSVKTGSYKMIKKDTDFFIRYAIVNPYFYDVWLCNNCGYAAMKQDFNKLKNYQIELAKEKIKPRWNKKQYPDLYDVDIAIERYKLALLNSVLTDGKASKKAMTCLKIAWMYRIKENNENELVFLKQALEGFTLAYESEDTPFYGMDDFTLMYLLGELNRKIGNFDASLSWFSKVITSPSASQKLKDLARDQKDLAKETPAESENDNTEVEVSTEQDTVKEDKKGFFSKLFHK